MKKKATIEAEHSEAIAKAKADNIESDKLLIKALYGSVQGIQIPDFKSDDGIQLGADMTEVLGIAKKMIINTANDLIKDK